MHATRFWLPIFAFAVLMASPARAQLTTINCNTAVHIADFKACAQAHASGLAAGKYWYVAFNATNHTAVQVTAAYFARSGKMVYSPIAYKASGAIASTDADLGVVNATLLATVNLAAGTPNLNIAPDQVDSLLDVEFPEVLTRNINSDLLSLMGPLYNNLPIGTTVMVTCTGDGTNAQFKKISSTGTVMWEMVPGTLKNKAGKFIDSKGNVIANPVNNLGAPGFLGALPTFPGVGLAPGDWLWWSNLPNGTVTVGDLCIPDAPC